jgi:serine O-acetyltransferase
MGSNDAQGAGSELEAMAARITQSILEEKRLRRFSHAPVPDRTLVIRALERLLWLVFPGYVGPRELTEAELADHVPSVLTEARELLLGQVAVALQYVGELAADFDVPPDEDQPCDLRARRVVDAMLRRLPEVRRLVSLDVQAAYDGDPAARHTDETILCYPGIRALSIHRLAHELHRLHVPLLPRIWSEHAHSITGIDIHPGARISESFFIDHGTGVVIGETTIIGGHCKIYQGVTLGARSFVKDPRGRLRRGIKRHPTLEDHVTVYAGATILGGDTVIGAGSVINGGVFLTSSVPPGHVVRGPKFDVTLRSNPELPPTMYNI